jgi:hypothetical protein
LFGLGTQFAIPEIKRRDRRNLNAGRQFLSDDLPSQFRRLISPGNGRKNNQNGQISPQFTSENGFPFPQNDFLAPENGFLVPQNHFLAPQNGFLAPQNHFLAPENGFRVPQNRFLGQENGFLAPQNRFLGLENGFLVKQTAVGVTEFSSLGAESL